MAMEMITEFIRQHPVVVVGCVICGVIIFTKIRNYGKKKVQEIMLFSEKYLRPRAPLVIDQKDRNAVLKQRFKTQQIPHDLDAIVVGSGIGGLAVAVLLGRAGKRVLVLEQHDVAGGCCHTFVEKGFEFDTGIHYVGEMNKGYWARTLLDQLTEGQVDWVPMDQDFDVVAIGDPSNLKKYPMKSGPKTEFFDQLKVLFPDNKNDIDKYHEIVKSILGNILAPYVIKFMPLNFAKFLVDYGIYRFLYKHYFKYSEIMLQDVVNGITNNPELKAVLMYLAGDYGLLPNEAPFSLHASMIHHYQHGAFYPDGGSSEIPFQMISIIEQLGGRVLVKAPVTKILTNSTDQAIGVRVHKSSGDVDVFAKMVISDAGAINTFTKLLPKQISVKSPLYPIVEKLGSGYTFFTVFVGLRGTKDELDLPSSNIWYCWNLNMQDSLYKYMQLGVDDLKTAPFPMLYVSFPSAKDPSWDKRHPGKSSVLIIALSCWDWFSQWNDEKVRHRGDQYEDLKKAVGDTIWNQCCGILPQLEHKVEFFEVGTPVSNSYYLGRPKGEAFGLDMTKTRFSLDSCLNLRPETGIPGLYLTGQDPCTTGFLGATMGAVICASKILDRNVYSDLMKLHKSLSKKKNKND